MVQRAGGAGAGVRAVGGAAPRRDRSVRRRATSTRSAPRDSSPHRSPASTSPTSGCWPARCAPREKPLPLPRSSASRAARPSCSAARSSTPDGLASVDDAACRGRRARPPRWPALLRRARDVLLAGGTSEEVLWSLWSGTTWPDAAARRRAPGRAARPAPRTATSTPCWRCSTRRRASRSTAGTPVSESFLATLAAQQIPADTLAEQGVRGDAVRLLTAHRSKGLEWRLVVVAHVQEDGWPDLRRRATLLQADRIGVHGLAEPTTTRTLLADERRLFYVACTRARERLVVTAVQVERRGRRAAVAVPRRARARRRAVDAPLGPGPSARCRSTGWSPSCDALPPTSSEPEALRRAAARRLAVLAEVHRARRGVGPGRRPGVAGGACAQPSRSDEPLRTPRRAGPDLGQRPDLARDLPGPVVPLVRGPRPRGRPPRRRASATSRTRSPTGSVASELDGQPCPTSTQVDELMEHVDRVWGQVPFRTPWSGEREREELRKALARFLAWRQAPDARELIGDRAAARRARRAPRRHPGPALRLRRPARARRGRPRRRRRPQDQQVPADQRRGRGAPAARPLPARGRARRRRDAGAAAPSTAAPSCGSSAKRRASS